MTKVKSLRGECLECGQPTMAPDQVCLDCRELRKEIEAESDSPILPYWENDLDLQEDGPEGDDRLSLRTAQEVYNGEVFRDDI